MGEISNNIKFKTKCSVCFCFADGHGSHRSLIHVYIHVKGASSKICIHSYFLFSSEKRLYSNVISQTLYSWTVLVLMYTMYTICTNIHKWELIHAVKHPSLHNCSTAEPLFSCIYVELVRSSHCIIISYNQLTWLSLLGLIWAHAQWAVEQL